jgi:hypothetical protein
VLRTGVRRRKIRPDRQHVVPGDFREIRIGECRIITRAVARHALMQRAVEFAVGPCAQSGFAVRRQVRREDAAKRGIDPFSPGERFCGVGGMATGAIGGVDQRLAARDGLRRRRRLRVAGAERSAQKHCAQNGAKNRSCRLASSLHRCASLARRYNLNCGAGRKSRPFATGLRKDITRKPLLSAWQRNCVLRARVSVAEICGA